MAKSTNLKVVSWIACFDPYNHLLRRWLVHGQLHGTSDGPSMKPSVGIDANCLARELF
jgi:hypothetical protein